MSKLKTTTGIEISTSYKTPDGKLFDSMDKAREHLQFLKYQTFLKQLVGQTIKTIEFDRINEGTYLFIMESGMRCEVTSTGDDMTRTDLRIDDKDGSEAPPLRGAALASLEATRSKHR